ncbi:MAG: PAS domain S-box protein [Syntrophales bacterium]|jgi:PAS domain S-box-containing protein
MQDKKELIDKDDFSRYKTVFENIEEGYFELDLAGNITFFNESLCRMLGYSAKELIGMNYSQYIPPEGVKRVYEFFHELYLTGISGKLFDYEAVRKDGLRRYFEISASLMRNASDKPTGFRVLARDVTDHKQAEKALRVSEEKYRLSFGHVSDVIFTVDGDFRIVSVSPSVEKILGYKPEEIIGQSIQKITNIIAPESLEVVLSNSLKIMNGEHISDAIYIFMAKDGTRKIGEVNAAPLTVDGKIIGGIGVARDITERDRTEKALEKSLDKLRKSLGATIQAMSIAVETRDPYTAGHQHRVADLARSIATEMGLSRDQIDSIRMASTIHDIGKISIPAEILSKPSKLTELEFKLIKTHAQSGYDMLKDIEFPWPIARIVLEHHERMNGTGYPHGLKGEQILLESRVLMVADVVEAMGSHRPYRPSKGIDLALDEISKNRGTFYDPEVVDACLRLFNEKGYKLVE